MTIAKNCFMESVEKKNDRRNRRRSSSSFGDHKNEEGSNKKMRVLPLIDKVGGQWEKLFYKMADEFYKLDGGTPHDHFLILPTKAFITRERKSKPVQKVFDSKRYIPEMLRGLGIAITDDSLAFSKGDSLIDFYESKAGGVNEKSLINKLKKRLNLQENQICTHSNCFMINFNANHRGHGWRFSIQKPCDTESWPPQWFITAASFLLPTYQDTIMASDSVESSISNSSSVHNISSSSPIGRQDEMESSITNQNNTASSLLQLFDNNSHKNIDSAKNSMESSPLKFDSSTNVTGESTSAEITSTTTTSFLPGDHLSDEMNMLRPDNAKEKKIDKESYVPEKLQIPLVSFKPTLSKKTIKTRKNETLQWTSDPMLKHANSRRNNMRELLSFLHTVSGGDQQRAALILEDVINKIPVAKEKLLKNTVDTDIVSSISDTVKSFGDTGRTKQTQQCLDAITFAAVANLNPGASREKVRRRLNLTTNAMAKAKTRTETYREQLINAETPQFEHIKRKTHSNSHRLNGAEQCVYEYCHSDSNAIRVESNNAKPIIVKRDENRERHPKRIWDGVVTRREKYSDFCVSDEYQIWKSLQSSQRCIIGERSFLEMICPCVKDASQEDCVDQIAYDLKLAMTGLSRATLHKAKSCKCKYHESFNHGTSFILKSGTQPLENLLLKSNMHLACLTCCPRRKHDNLKCGIGSTATNPFLIPWECVYSEDHKECGVRKVLGNALECPVFNDTSSVCRIQYFDMKAETGGITQPEIRDMYLPVKDAVDHFFKCLQIYRVQHVEDKWTRHSRKLEQTMGDPKKDTVNCTDFMATANFQAQARANSAIDGHAMNAIYLSYCNWRKVLYSTQKVDFSTNEPKLFEDWVIVEVETEARIPQPNKYGILPGNHCVYRKASYEVNDIYSYLIKQIGSLRETVDSDVHEKMLGSLVIPQMVKIEDARKLVVEERREDDFEYSMCTWIEKNACLSSCEDLACDDWVVIGHEYEVTFTEVDIENDGWNEIEQSYDTIDRGEDYTKIGDLRDGWVWVNGDECIVNETHCFHYIGESETKNKDNNFQYDLACTNDLIRHREREEEERRQLSEQTEYSGPLSTWAPSYLIPMANYEEIEVTVYAIASQDDNGELTTAIVKIESKHQDNCASQYKNCFQATATALAEKIHPSYQRRMRFAIKFTFKGNWDGEGKVLKSQWKRSELKGEERIENAPKGFEYGRKKLTRDNYHRVWTNVSICDSDYAISCKQADQQRDQQTDQVKLGTLIVQDEERGPYNVFVTLNEIYESYLSLLERTRTTEEEITALSLHLHIRSSYVFVEDPGYIARVNEGETEDIEIDEGLQRIDSLVLPDGRHVFVTLNEIHESYLSLLERTRTTEEEITALSLHLHIRSSYSYKDFVHLPNKYRAEVTGGIFSRDIVRRAPQGIVFCSDETILQKRISSMDTRTLRFATGDLTKYFKLSSVPDYRHSIVFVDRRTDIIPDPGTCRIGDGIQKVFEMQGVPLANRNATRNDLCQEVFELNVRGMYCSCDDCRSGREETCKHLKSMGRKGDTTTVPLTNQGTIEYFRCLCCGSVICLYDQALRHSTRRECESLNRLTVRKDDTPLLQQIYDTSIVKCQESTNRSFRLLQHEYEELHLCHWELPYRDCELQRFGLDILFNNDYQLSYINSINHNSCPCLDSIPEQCRDKAWILSINGKEVRSMDEIFKVLNDRGHALTPTLIVEKIEKIDADSKSKKKDYIALARECNFQFRSKGKKVAQLKEMLLECVEEYIKLRELESQQEYREFDIVLSKKHV